MIKYIKSNYEYFKFINKNKDKYKIISVKPLLRTIKVQYEKLS